MAKENDLNIDITAAIIGAIIGAIPGVASLIWQFCTYYSQKPRVVIDSSRKDYPNLIVDEKLCPNQFGGPHLSLNLEISNTGNSPYTIRNIQAWYPKDKSWVPLLNRKYYLCGLKIRNENIGETELLKFNQFGELKRPLKIEAQDTKDIHFCVSPDCLQENNTICLRFYNSKKSFDKSFQLETPKEFFDRLNYTVLKFLPPDAETIERINHP